ncbi:hypothetical protein SY2F82_72260 [Streptomyces sp. Y2F8-2]|nr:hypothetical protein SY2F82_72260 [Streptomyces sp. Y2F8-2]
MFNSVDNPAVEPFAAPVRRPEFIGARDFTPVRPARAIHGPAGDADQQKGSGNPGRSRLTCGLARGGSTVSRARHGANITPFPRSNVFIVFNSVENAAVEPFAAPVRRPEFIGARDFTPVR